MTSSRTQPASPRPKHRILLLGSNPADTERLELDAERAAIEAELRNSDRRDDFDLQIACQAEAGKLPGLIMRFEPQILHFGGHGDEEGELLFATADGTGQLANKKALARVFGVLGGTVRCVVLNACYSEAQALLIAEHVDVVIGMRRSFEDRSAIAFAAGFYEALGYGKSFAVAFELAKARISLIGLPDEEQPVMHVRDGVDAATVTLPDLTVDTSESPLATARPTRSVPILHSAARAAILVGVLLSSSALLIRILGELVAEGPPGPTTVVTEGADPDRSDDRPPEDVSIVRLPSETILAPAKSNPKPSPSPPKPVDTWTVTSIGDVAAGDSKRIGLKGPTLPAAGFLLLRTPGDGRRFVSDVKCRIESGSSSWCMLVTKPGNDGLEVGDVLELIPSKKTR